MFFYCPGLISFNSSRVLAPNQCPPIWGGSVDALAVMASHALILSPFLLTLTLDWMHNLVMMARNQSPLLGAHRLQDVENNPSCIRFLLFNHGVQEDGSI